MIHTKILITPINVSVTMASVRTTSIGGIPYLQVVEYVKSPEGKAKIDVVKSFGRDGMENRMKAEQFAASYDKLKEVAKDMKDEKKGNSDDVVNTALAVFGVILGAAIVGAVLGEIFKDK